MPKQQVMMGGEYKPRFIVKHKHWYLCRKRDWHLSLSDLCRFLDPIVFGTYPAEMYEILGSSLPTFSKNDMQKLHEGLDFIGINHYTSLYAKDCMFSACEFGMGSSQTEGYAQQTGQKDGINIGEPVDYLTSSYSPSVLWVAVQHIDARISSSWTCHSVQTTLCGPICKIINQMILPIKKTRTT